MIIALLIGLGGAIGSMSRYGLSEYVRSLTESRWPWAGTLLINVIGCLLIGVVNGSMLPMQAASKETWRLMLVAGFLGGFTTFSAFGWETASLLRDGQRSLAFGYVLLSNGLGLAAVGIGLLVARRLVL